MIKFLQFPVDRRQKDIEIMPRKDLFATEYLPSVPQILGSYGVLERKIEKLLLFLTKIFRSL